MDYCLSDSLPSWLRPAQYVPDPSYWNAGLVALTIMIAGGAILGAGAGLLWYAAGGDGPSGAEARLAGGPV